MFVILVVVVGNIATSAALSGLNLDCTNNYENRMSCHFDAPNCTDYNVTLWSLNSEEYCLPVQCASGKCCCSIRMILILDDNHTAFVRRGGEYVESKNISVKYSFKPQTPTIISMDETNRNFQVTWRTNINKMSVIEKISTHLTYRKKGETQEMTEVVKAPQVEKQLCNFCFTTEILGAHLEPSTTYVVTVQNLWESQPSDRSEEYEFTTPASRESLLLTLIISLSLFAITISSAAYVCYVKCRAKYWDSVSNQNSKLLNIYPSKEEVLKPIPPIISSIYIEALAPGDLKPWSKGSLIDSSTESLLQSSGISSGPPSLSYACAEAADIIAGVQGALSKALMNIVPTSASTNHLLKESSKPTGVLSTRPSPCNSEQHSGLENAITYSFIRPSCPVQVIPETLKSHAEPQMLLECGYQDTGNGSTCDDKRGSSCEENMFPTWVSSYTLNARSHQQANRDSGRFSIGENSDTSLSCSNTSLCGDVKSRKETGHERCQEMFSGACSKGEDATKEGKGLICDLASLQGNFPVDDNYQAVQGVKELADRPFEEQKKFTKQDLNKALENYSKDATKGDTCFPAHSNHSFLVDDNYQAFQGLRELTDNQFGEQKSSKKAPDKVLQNSSEDATKGDTCVPATSNRCLLIADSEEAFQGLTELPVGLYGSLKTVGKRPLDKVLENSLENITKSGTCISTSSNFNCLVDDNYQVFRGLELSDSQFEEEKGGKQNQDKVLENAIEDATKGHTCVPPSSNCSFLVDDNYQVFQDVRELSNSQFGQQNSGNKDNLKKTLENSFEGVCMGDNWTPAKSNPSFPIDDNYQAFHGLREHSGNQVEVGERTIVEKEYLVKDVENPVKDSTEGDQGHTCVPANRQGSLPVDDNYQVCRGLRELSNSHFGKQNSENKDLEKPLENCFEGTTKGNTCIPASSNPNVPIDDNYLAFHGLRHHSDKTVVEPSSGEKEDLGKVLETPLKYVRTGVQCYTCVPAILQDSLRVDANYQVFQSLKEPTDTKLAGQRSDVKKTGQRF